MSDPAAARGPIRGRLRALRPEDRYVFDGRKTTVGDAQAIVSYPVLLPNTSAANEANLAEVWVNSKRAVALVFDGEIVITMAPAIHLDPVRWFETFIAENNVVAAIGQVHGQPALVITPNTDFYKSNPAWVEFYSDGIDINVHSHSHGTATLLAVANSMQ